jgi:uncharacterized membrane protein YgdD (TMEM256/DUF423 family)
MHEQRGRHRASLITGIWAAANILLILFGAFWVALASGLESECESGDCNGWATADAYAVGLSVAALIAAAIARRRRRWWLALSSLALCVPVFHALFV